MSPEPTRTSWRLLLSPPGSLRTRAWHWIRKRSRSVLGWQGPETLDLETLSSGEKGRRWLIVTGCPGASRRYRVDHLKMFLESAGANVAILQAEDSRLKTQRGLLLQSVDGLIFQRARAELASLRLRDEARKQGLKTIYECDDLVFEKSSLNAPGKTSQTVYLNDRDIKQHREMLVGCKMGLCSSKFLQRQMLARGLRRVFLFRNGYSEELEKISREARKNKSDDSEIFRMGYASGTPTHDEDFAIVSDVLAEALNKHSQLRLSIIGPLKLQGALSQFQHQIEREAWLDWRDLPSRLARWDLNLAPFSLGSPFNQGKSAVKFLEAALVSVSTLASPLPAYSHAAELGPGLVLASTPEAWSNALSEAIDDREATRQRGKLALETVEAHFSPEQRRRDALELLSQLNRED